jgi:glycosyltransferase involved in cell wall biosynthesis
MVNSARKVSGAEEYLLDLAGNIGTYGYTPAFFARAGGVLESRSRSCGHSCHAVFGGNPLRVPLAIAAALCCEQPDIVLIGRDHNIYAVIAGSLLALPRLRKKPKIVATLHTPTGRRYPLAINFLDGIIASSDYTGKTFYRANPGWEKIATTIHCGIGTPAVIAGKDLPDRPRRVLAGRGFPVIGMVGELWKNQTELIDVGALLQKSYPDITIAIVGGGDDSELRAKIAAYGLEQNFVLTGRIPRETIHDLFFDLDLSVSTHRNEGFGIVHIESLAASTPVVAYNCGGLVEILNKGGGLLVNGGVADLAREIIDLLQDDDRRRAMGAEGRRVFAENFTVDAMVGRHRDFFEGLLS